MPPVALQTVSAVRVPYGTHPWPDGQSLSRAQEVAAIFDDGVQYPTLAVEPSGAVAVGYSRQLEDVGQSASLRHIVLQKSWLGKSGVAMQSESSAQCIPAPCWSSREPRTPARPRPARRR